MTLPDGLLGFLEVFNVVPAQIRQTMNEDQRAAVMHDTGPCLCLAGAGAGKTRVLTARIARLVRSGVRPERIMAITFTKNAANEMRSRLTAHIPPGAARRVAMGTFHSLFWRLILQPWWRETRNPRAAFEPSKGHEASRFVRETLEEVNADRERHGMDPVDWPVPEAAKWIEAQKQRMRAPGDVPVSPGPDGRVMADVYAGYEQRKTAANRIDFGDMLLLTHRLLSRNPAALRRYQAAWDHILVDEYQDTDPVQYEALTLLAAGHRNLFVTGDDSQAVYRFRGAEVENILRFEQDYPDARRIVLGTNYRSTDVVVEAGNRLITHNEHRLEKTIRAAVGAGEPVQIIAAADADGEAALIAQEIQALHKAGTAWRDIACLYRTNAQSRALEDACLRAEIPHVVVGGTGFYGRREVADLVAYLRLAANSADDEAFRRIYNAPNRYLGRAFLQSVEQRASADRIPLFAAARAVTSGWDARPYQARGVDDLATVIQDIAGKPPGEALAHVRTVTGYDEYLRKQYGIAEDGDDDRLDNIRALIDGARKYRSTTEFLAFVDQATEAAKKAADPEADVVRLSTIHRAKGLEWDTVFISGCAEGLLPHRAAVAAEEADDVAPIEEERRLGYVAITRAKRRLYAGVPAMVWGKPATRSRFLGEAGIWREEVGQRGEEVVETDSEQTPEGPPPDEREAPVLQMQAVVGKPGMMPGLF